MRKLNIEGITHITFNRWLDVIKPENRLFVSSQSYKHSELECVLQDESIIKVTYILGQKKQREKQLQQLGFQLKEVLWDDATEKHHKIISVWERV